jgi:6-phosphogluconolactonase
MNVFPNRNAMSLAVARSFVHSAAAADSLAIALTGGSTPESFYRLLATDFRSHIPWERIHVFWSDERYVKQDHPQSNVGMSRKALLDLVQIPAANVHAPDTELADADEAAAQYEQEVRNHLGAEPCFDWMLLGLGEDGHVASLFPGSTATRERKRLVVAIDDSPKPPPLRLTMTPPLINRSREIHMLVAGASKRRALSDLMAGNVTEWLRPPTIWADEAAIS